jgi:hypothetical protein
MNTCDHIVGFYHTWLVLSADNLKVHVSSDGSAESVMEPSESRTPDLECKERENVKGAKA